MAHQFPVGHPIQQVNPSLDTLFFEEATRELDIQPVWTAFEKGGLMRGVESGRLYGVVGIRYDKQKERLGYFSLPYRQEKSVLFIKKDKLNQVQGKTFEDILNEDLVIGIVEGEFYGDNFEQKADKSKAFKTFTSRSTENNMIMLKQGRLDGFIANESEVFENEDVVSTDVVIDVYDVCVFVGKDTKEAEEIVRRVNENNEKNH
jgi:ABC-type amino acid transport substrate-binding protein